MQKIAAVSLALLLGSTACVQAQPVAPGQQRTFCAPRAQIVERLETRFGEKRIATMLASDNHIVEIFASDSGSWSILRTDAKGIGCMADVGEMFDFENAPVVGSPTPPAPDASTPAKPIVRPGKGDLEA